MQRGEIWWAELEEPRGSGPGYRRPLLVIQSDAFNRSRIQTVIGIVLTSNLRLIEAPGNTLLPKRISGLPRDSVANVSQIVTIDRELLTQRAGRLERSTMAAVENGLRLVLDLNGSG